MIHLLTTLFGTALLHSGVHSPFQETGSAGTSLSSWALPRSRMINSGHRTGSHSRTKRWWTLSVTSGPLTEPWVTCLIIRLLKWFPRCTLRIWCSKHGTTDELSWSVMVSSSFSLFCCFPVCARWSVSRSLWLTLCLHLFSLSLLFVAAHKVKARNYDSSHLSICWEHSRSNHNINFLFFLSSAPPKYRCRRC